MDYATTGKVGTRTHDEDYYYKQTGLDPKVVTEVFSKTETYVNENIRQAGDDAIPYLKDNEKSTGTADTYWLPTGSQIVKTTTGVEMVDSDGKTTTNNITVNSYIDMETFSNRDACIKAKEAMVKGLISC